MAKKSLAQAARSKKDYQAKTKDPEPECKVLIVVKPDIITVICPTKAIEVKRSSGNVAVYDRTSD